MQSPSPLAVQLANPRTFGQLRDLKWVAKLKPQIPPSRRKNMSSTAESLACYWIYLKFYYSKPRSSVSFVIVLSEISGGGRFHTLVMATKPSLSSFHSLPCEWPLFELEFTHSLKTSCTNEMKPNLISLHLHLLHVTPHSTADGILWRVTNLSTHSHFQGVSIFRRKWDLSVRHCLSQKMFERGSVAV